jgi:hypothetical protein
MNLRAHCTALISICLATACTSEETTRIAESAADTTPLTNSCNGTDTSHTLDPVVTCKYTVNGSSGTNGKVTAQGPWYYDIYKYMARCFIEGFGCSGNGEKKPITCSSPEYPATNQDYACPASWRNDSMYTFLGEVYWVGSGGQPPKPTADEVLAKCKEVYATEINAYMSDPAGAANKLCNQKATNWTERSKKAPICCVPSPTPTPTPTPTSTTDTSGVGLEVFGPADLESCADCEAVPPLVDEPFPDECFESCVIQ